ncbi:hypothetical protein JQM66_11185 [Oscillibacter valericigenes]|nr:hypothetical protein [Oscillibacter valericigenes]
MWKTLPKEPFSKLIIPQFFCFGCVIVSFSRLEPFYLAFTVHWLKEIPREFMLTLKGKCAIIRFAQSLSPGFQLTAGFISSVRQPIHAIIQAAKLHMLV